MISPSYRPSGALVCCDLLPGACAPGYCRPSGAGSELSLSSLPSSTLHLPITRQSRYRPLPPPNGFEMSGFVRSIEFVGRPDLRAVAFVLRVDPESSASCRSACRETYATVLPSQRWAVLQQSGAPEELVLRSAGTSPQAPS